MNTIHKATHLAGIPQGLQKVHKEQAKPDSHIFSDSSPGILCIVVKLIYKVFSVKICQRLLTKYAI